MPSPTSRYGFLAVVAVGTLLCASILVAVPRLGVADTTVPTQFVIGVVAGLLTVSVAVSELRDSDHRSALQFGLLGIGVPLALSEWHLVVSVGAALTLLSVPVAWQTDRWLRDRFVDGAG
jgi:hypothetical protein